MNDRNPPEEFADVNEAVGEEWEAETTPYERIRHVVAHTYSPVSADAVADDARTAPKTARKHLNTLADEGFVETTPGEQGGTLYRRSPESLVVEQAADILEHVSTDELVTRIQEMREQLTEYRSEFGVDSPKNWRSTRRIRPSARPGPHRTRSTQRRFVSGRRCAGISRSRTLPSRSATPSNSSTVIVGRLTTASLPE